MVKESFIFAQVRLVPPTILSLVSYLDVLMTSVYQMMSDKWLMLVNMSIFGVLRGGYGEVAYCTLTNTKSVMMLKTYQDLCISLTLFPE